MREEPRRRAGTWTIALALTLLAGGAAAWAAEPRGHRPPPRYAMRERVERPRVARTAVAVDVPVDLQIEVLVRTSEANASEPLPVEMQDSVTRTRRPVVEDLDRAAREAGFWAAEEKARDGGRRAYYRVGFRLGMQAALDDPSLGAWDHRDGIAYGLRDPEAIALGEEIAAAAAAGAVGSAARKQVAGQFRDLSREPLFRPRPEPPPFHPAIPAAMAPDVQAVFATVTPRALDDGGERFELAFRNWGLDPARIHGAAGYRHVYEAVWSDPRHGFEFWLQGKKRSSVFRSIADSSDRRRFRAVFEHAFARSLRDHFGVYLARGFREGVRDGWDYGALVSYELSFRMGYNEGFDQAAASAATSFFVTAYAEEYSRAYEAAFNEWNATARPGILRVTVLDGNDDGVFEPGEELLVEYEVANYGGAPGRFTAELAGSGLEAGASAVIELSGRGAAGAAEPLAAALRPGLAPGRETRLSLRIGPEERAVPVRVAYPLEFRGAPRIVRQDTLEGAAVIEVRLANTSRRPVPARVELARVDGYDLADTRDLEVIPGGGEAAARFELGGVHPLDLLSGDLRMSFTALREGAVLDAMDFSLPEKASDLGDRDLLVFMIELARSPDAPYQDVEQARRLMLRRLRADWQEAAHGEGNPYKDDLQKHGTRTALGDLVQTVRRERRDLRSPEVFDGLAAEIEELAEDLPGAHPFLRKAMKKLARELG